MLFEEMRKAVEKCYDIDCIQLLSDLETYNSIKRLEAYVRALNGSNILGDH